MPSLGASFAAQKASREHFPGIVGVTMAVQAWVWLAAHEPPRGPGGTTVWPAPLASPATLAAWPTCELRALSYAF